MTEFSDHLDRLKQLGGEFAVRIRPHHLAVAAGVAVIGVAALAVGAMARPGSRAAIDGERLQIQVVAPVEPVVTPGPVMDVGHLIDGPVSIPSPQLAVEPLQDAYYEDEPVELRKPRSGPKRYVEEAVVHAPPQPEPPDAGRRDSRADRRFGFDAPQPDYRAEREARRADRTARAERDRERRDTRRRQDDDLPPGYRD